MNPSFADDIRLALIRLTDKAVNPVPGLSREETLESRAAGHGLHRFPPGLDQLHRLGR